jgi:hypothetical protein
MTLPQQDKADIAYSQTTQPQKKKNLQRGFVVLNRNLVDIAERLQKRCQICSLNAAILVLQGFMPGGIHDEAKNKS